MSASAGPITALVLTGLAARGIRISPNVGLDFARFLAAADLRYGGAPGLLPPNRIEVLLDEIQDVSRNGPFDNAGLAAVQLKICPGFWPFC